MTKSASLDSSLTETRNVGRERSGCVGDNGVGMEVSQRVCRGGGERRTSSVPPGRGSRDEVRAGPSEVRPLPGTEEMRGQEGASLRSHPVGPPVQSEGLKRTEPRSKTGKNKKGDIRNFFK